VTSFVVACLCLYLSNLSSFVLQRCELCPIRDGALKRTDNQAWAHVVCALYIPEVRFGNVTTMEPIILQLIPPERYNKVSYQEFHLQCRVTSEPAISRTWGKNLNFPTSSNKFVHISC